MDIYFLILFIASSFSIIEVILSFDKSRKHSMLIVIFWFLVVTLILFAGLRRVGADFENYEIIYDVLAEDSSWSDWRVITLEPGFKSLMVMLKYTNFQFSLLVCAFLGVTLKAKFISKYSPYPILSLVIYFSSLFIIKEMGQIRNGIAMGIVLWSFDALIQQKKTRFLFLTFLAILFHWSAFCVLPLFFFGDKKIPTSAYVFSILAIFFMILFNLTSVISNLISFVPIEAITSKADSYLSGDSEFAERLGLNSTFLFLVMIMSIMLLYRHRLNSKFPKFDLILNVYILGIFYFGFFNAVSEFALRLNVYFRMLDIIILPLIVSLFGPRKIIIAILLCVNSLWTLNKYSQSPLGKFFFPYKSTINRE